MHNGIRDLFSVGRYILGAARPGPAWSCCPCCNGERVSAFVLLATCPVERESLPMSYSLDGVHCLPLQSSSDAASSDAAAAAASDAAVG